MTDYQTPLNERTLISTQEYQQLRAEVERLVGIVAARNDETGKLRAEVERLRTNQNTVLAAELRAIKEAELRADVERLRTAHAEDTTGYGTMIIELTELRAEVERLDTLVIAKLAEINELRAEGARLRGENVRQKSLIAQYELLLMPETKP